MARVGSIQGVRTYAAISLMLLWSQAACGRSLEDGLYRFDLLSVAQDSCSAGPDAPKALPSAEIEVRGDGIFIDFVADGPMVAGVTGARGRNALIGRFLPDREVERFIADATFDVVQEIQGLSCITFSHVSLIGRIVDSRAFRGSLRVDYTRRPQAQPDCIPSCVLELEYEASRQD